MNVFRVVLACIALLAVSCVSGEGTGESTIEDSEALCYDASTAWVYDLFASFDAGDLDAWAERDREDVVLVFGDAPEVMGRAAKIDVFASLLPALSWASHDVQAVWRRPGGVVAVGVLELGLPDDRVLSYRFATSLSTAWMHGRERVARYQVFVGFRPTDL